MRARLIAAFLLSALVLTAHAQGVATLRVDHAGGQTADIPCPADRTASAYASIGAALGCAQSGDVIAIAAGTYRENLTLDNAVVLRGAGRDVTMLDGGGAGRVVTVADNVAVTLEALTLTGGSANLGAGVYTYAGLINLTDVLVTGNTAAISGGGVYSYAGRVRVTNSRIAGNSAPEGAGIYGQVAAITIIDSDIADSAVSATGTLEVVTAQLTEIPLVIPTETTAALEPTILATATPAAMMTTLPPPTDAPVPVPTAAPLDPSSAAAQDARIAIDWMDAVYRSAKREGYSPPVVSRLIAYAGVTLYESIVPGMPGYRSLTGGLNGLSPLPQPEPGMAYDWPVVANAALGTVTAGLFSESTAETLTAFSTLRERIDFARGEVVPVNAFIRSQEYGAAVGQAILDWATQDNYGATRALTYNVPAGDPAYWVPLNGQQPLEPYWGMLRPIALPFSAACFVPLDVPFSTEAGSPFYEEAMEVYRTGQSLTPEQEMTARYWADTPGETASPPGHWLAIMNQIAELRQPNLEEAAEMYALTGIAIGDAFISAWQAKYQVQLIRPINYVQTYIDPTWQPLLGTPAVPEYPSGHSVVSGAAAAVLKALYGDMTFLDTAQSPLGLPPRSFNSFEEAAQEAAMSRLYGGIHYRSAIDNGLQQGRCVAAQVLERAMIHDM
ncbi:MAG: phosphatase PAP2 family protein [Chloroflexi bacterium]|nr:phosphatase PAP2 family protein [Chloroflexota bacterium]